MGPMLKALSTRNVLLLLWGIRIISGAVYVQAVMLPADSTMAIPLIYLSRALHGLTLFNLAIAGTWAGTHLSVDDRKGPIQAQVGFMSFGIVFGPLLAASLAFFMPNDTLKYALPGALTVVFNMILLLVTVNLFSDGEKMVMQALDGSKPAEMTPKEKTVANIVLFTAFMYSWGYMGTLEPTLSLDVKSFFDWGAGENCATPCTALHYVCQLAPYPARHRCMLPFTTLRLSGDSCLLGVLRLPVPAIFATS